ncbi:MAG: TauD/TfdA family dioxygenase [Actinomycetia bacterium]|nr:TauD/TfdA family dioxygenase [Actinomycetes bacterium]
MSSFRVQPFEGARFGAEMTGLEIKHGSTHGSSGLLGPGMSPPASPMGTIGQVVVWDNRMMLHKRDPYEVRFMWRTQTKGEGVVAVAG